MQSVPFSREMRRAAKGSALIIVLFFVILLTVVTIAFLSRSLTAVKVAASSAGETKASFMASSASDIIIGDLKQEIIAGSSSVGTVNFPVYTPTSNLTMIPFQSGVPSGNAIPNMISRSVSPSNTSGSSPYVAYTASYTSSLTPINRAASDSSAASETVSATYPYTTTKVSSSYPSINGRYVSPAQWNSHYLIPRTAALVGTTSADSTPVTSFVPPDWVVVTRGGATTSVSASSPGFGTGGLNDNTLSNNNYAIGRYAYAVYNEGGLLDMNVAGYPADPNLTATSTPPFYSGTPNGLTPLQSGKKSSLALADLTQLTTGTVSLKQAQINSFVGWRNYASAELSSANGNFGSFAFTPSTASNWLTNFVLGNTNGFLQITPPATGVTTPPTDQALLSRQQLISVIQSLSISPDFLQYMGTFSRALEQPSTVPDPNRPKILTTSGMPPAYGSADSYTGNNNGEGGDTDPTGINPSFLAIRVKTAFTRMNGTTAVVGEPLVKTKFPLSYMTWLTYKGPSALRTSVINNSASSYSSPASSDYDIYLLEYQYGISNALLQQGTAANILAAFGLTYNNTTASWTYDHTSISTLTSISGREADFAELLKASILAGSLAKGGPNLNPSQGYYNYQYTVDTSLDAAVIQIMANLIDQQDVDSFPTAITIGTTTVYGVEDLPYFYRYHLMSVVDQLPVTALSPPQFSKNLTQTFTAKAGDTTTGTLSGLSANGAINYLTGAAQTATWTLSNTNPATINGAAQTSLISAGDVAFLIIPDIWNPTDPNTLSTSTSLRPTQFRLYAITNDPLGTFTPWQMETESVISGSGTNSNILNGPLTSALTTVIPEKDSTNTYYNWPLSLNPPPYTTPTTPPYFTQATTTMTFTDNSGTLFREPTLLWNKSDPVSDNLTTTGTCVASVKDANTGQTYTGILQGKAPICIQATFSSTTSTGVSDPSPGLWGTVTPPTTVPVNTPNGYNGQINGTWVFEASSINRMIPPVSNSWNSQITFVMQYQDPSGNWYPYDVKYPDTHGLNFPPIVADAKDDYPNTYYSPLSGGGGDGQLSDQATCMDPRTARWSVGTDTQLGHAATTYTTLDYLLEPTANSDFGTASKMMSVNFSVIESNRPRGDPGDLVNYSNPCMTSDPGPAPGTYGAAATTLGFRNVQMRWFGAGQYRPNSAADPAAPMEYDGLFSQNNPAIQSAILSQSGSNATTQLYNEDADGVARLTMGAYTTSITDSSTSSLAPATADASRTGLPLATASTLSDSGIATATSQSQSRPMMLNRPFRSVGEMSYAFSGTPWKNIDFFTPASGDSALLDTFCVTAPPASGMVAGKVDLNTRQIPVLQAVVAGAYRDEVNNATASPPGYAMPPISGGSTTSEAYLIAQTLEKITSDTTDAWRGPLKNISGLVGRYVATPTGTYATDTDVYTYQPPNLASSSSGGAPGTTSLPSVSYAGLSSALDCSSFFGTANHVFQNAATSAAQVSSPLIQRFREAAIRPLAAAGQVRVWNLLIDIVAQTGHYPKTATSLDQFYVDGQKHLWVHVAIDRYTGQVIDKQIEVVTP